MILNRIEYLDVFKYLESVDDESIDLAIIDPPYNLNQGDWDSFKSLDNFLDFTYKYLDLVVKKLKKTGSLYVFNTAFNSAYILSYLVSKKMHFKNSIIWYKKDGFSATTKKFANNQETILFFTKNESKYTFNCDDVRVPYTSDSRIAAAQKKGILKNGKRWFPNPNGKLCPDVWEFVSVRLINKKDGKTKKQIHPTPKPEAMIERMIKASSNENDVVMDLFSGTGTTAYCAKKLNRKFTGCENNKIYFNYINERLKQ